MGNSIPDDETSRLLISDCESGVAKPLLVPTTNYDTLPLEAQFDSDESHRAPPTLLARSWSHYNLHLDQYPVLVKSVTAFFLLGLGDAFAQMGQQLVAVATPNHVGWDVLRSLRFGVFGLIGAPWTHYYYHALDSVFPPTPKPCSRTTCLKVFIDQFVQAPIALFFIIGGLDVMKGVSMAVLRSDLQVHYWSTLVINWKLWLPASIVNLAFVQPKLRVLFVNVVFFLWIIFLSVILNP